MPGKAFERSVAKSLSKEAAMVLATLREYLNKHNIKYVVLSHSPAYTAQGVAALSHIPGKELAKTVVVNLDGELMMAVLPACFQVDFAQLKKVTNAKDAKLASESEFRKYFPECETGAMPPFGNLYGVNVVVDETLAKGEEIAFNACSHRELIRLAWDDFVRLVRPKIARFAAARTTEAA
jgi:Ala-tRNA(Pro) deacylase